MHCELYLYDAIGADFFGDGITAKAVVAALKDAEAQGATSLRLMVNSPGGDVFEGVAIANAIDRFPGKKYAFIDGLAASAASYIPMVCDTITTAPDAMWMVHNAWGLCIGNAADMRASADLLEKVSGTLVGAYSKRTGLSAEAVQALMTAETWLTAAEALKLGFTDKVARPSDPEPDPAEPGEEAEPERMAAARRAAVLASFTKTPAALRPDTRAMIASMEARASPRAALPRTGAPAKK